MRAAFVFTGLVIFAFVAGYGLGWVLMTEQINGALAAFGIPT